jgi:hypothetical protein
MGLIPRNSVAPNTRELGSFSPRSDQDSTAISHQARKSGEMMICIMGAWTGFRVILNAKHGLSPMSERSHGAVVQIEMSNFYFLSRQ